MGPHFVDSNGSRRTASSILLRGATSCAISGADIAAEAGARQTYEALMKIAPDEGTKSTLAHSTDSRNLAHPHVHGRTAIARESSTTRCSATPSPPNETVNLYFNLSKDDTHEETPRAVEPKATISNILPIPSRKASAGEPDNPDDEGNKPGAKLTMST